MCNPKQCLMYLIAAIFLAGGALACGDIDETENQNAPNQHQNDENGNGEDDNGDNDSPNDEEEIAVAGTWENQWGDEEVIDDEMWDYMWLVDFDNDERWAITQNPEDDEHNPDAYNRLEWTPIDDDTFYYCIVDFGLETEEDARETEETADEGDLEAGCGGHPWTEMTKI